jgi:hypothetical protein
LNSFNTCLCAAPVDCVGAWSTCTAGCTKSYSITAAAISGGAACAAAEGDVAQCAPGSGKLAGHRGRHTVAAPAAASSASDDEAAAADGPAKKKSKVIKPRGRPPAGKQWGAKEGKWVPVPGYVKPKPVRGAAKPTRGAAKKSSKRKYDGDSSDDDPFASSGSEAESETKKTKKKPQAKKRSGARKKTASPKGKYAEESDEHSSDEDSEREYDYDDSVIEWGGQRVQSCWGWRKRACPLGASSAASAKYVGQRVRWITTEGRLNGTVVAILPKKGAQPQMWRVNHDAPGKSCAE